LDIFCCHEEKTPISKQRETSLRIQEEGIRKSRKENLENYKQQTKQEVDLFVIQVPFQVFQWWRIFTIKGHNMAFGPRNGNPNQ